MVEEISEDVEFFQNMREGGVATIDAEYSGAGDEGWIEFVNCYNADGQVLGSATERSLTSSSDLADIAMAWIDSVIDRMVGGYENNEGGGGQVLINIGEGVAQFDHYSYGEPVAYPEPFKVCVNVDTGEQSIESISVPDQDEIDQSTRRKAAAWDVMSGALDDKARRLCTATDVVQVGLRLQGDVREGSNGTTGLQPNDSPGGVGAGS